MRPLKQTAAAYGVSDGRFGGSGPKEMSALPVTLLLAWATLLQEPFSEVGNAVYPVLLCLFVIVAYAILARRHNAVREHTWPRARAIWFVIGIGTFIVTIDSPLDVAGDARFAPHMVQHLLLTDIVAPCVLLGAPLLLVLAVAPTTVARGIVDLLRSPLGRFVMNPISTWSALIVTLWVVHFTAFFEAALEHELLHFLEHALYVWTALIFWYPLIAIGPVPWSRSPLSYPIRMLYLLLAMAAEAVLGFTLTGTHRVLYAHYSGAGLADQQSAGEIMWVGGTFAMFCAFMIVGFQWAKHEQRLGERFDALEQRDVASRLALADD